MIAGRRNTRAPRVSAGFSLVEAVVCIALVGVVLVAALRTVGASAKSQAYAQRSAIGMMLAQDLMAEILDQPYTDPESSVEYIGRNSGESAGDRTGLDDVDDYSGYSSTPPKDNTNTSLTDYTGWTRSVSVGYVDPDDLSSAKLSDQGVKKITVSVYHGGYLAAELCAVRTSSWTLGEPTGDGN